MNLNCVICAELFSQSDEVYVTTCGHMFHYPCLRQWLERSKTCPQCRHKCYDKNIHRIYFNIANLDTSRVDVGALQEKLENVELKNKVAEKDLEKAHDEIQVLKDVQKKTMKTISGLEKKVEQKNFLILSFHEQMNILKCDNNQLKTENKEMKSQLELMSSVETVLSSTTAEVEKMLQEDNNKKALCVCIVALKRELRINENKKIDLRNALKVAQSDLRKEREAKTKLEERIVQLESENYRLNEQVKSLEQQKENPTSAKSIEDLTQNGPCSLQQQVKKIRLLDSTNTPSPSLSDKVKKIEESNSPYLNIKQSCVGLAPLLKLSSKIRKAETGEDSASTLTKSSSDLSDKYSIFKKPRLQVQNNTATSSNFVFNGIGSSDSRDEFSFFTPRIDKATKSKSISSRVKNGKLKKIPSFSGSQIDKYLEKE